MPQKIQQLSLMEYEQQDLSFVQNAINDWQGLAARSLITKAPQVIDSLAGILGLNTNIDTAILAGARIALTHANNFFSGNLYLVSSNSLLTFHRRMKRNLREFTRS